MDDDPIARARSFVDGKSFKRAELVDLIRELLTKLETRTYASVWADASAPPPPGTFQVTSKTPVQVQRCIAGAIFLGPEANRYYTRSEGAALADAIARATAP